MDQRATIEIPYSRQKGISNGAFVYNIGKALELWVRGW